MGLTVSRALLSMVLFVKAVAPLGGCTRMIAEISRNTEYEACDKHGYARAASPSELIRNTGSYAPGCHRLDPSHEIRGRVYHAFSTQRAAKEGMKSVHYYYFVPDGTDNADADESDKPGEPCGKSVIVIETDAVIGDGTPVTIRGGYAVLAKMDEHCPIVFIYGSGISPYPER